MEQALSKPSEFLGCECCEPDIGDDESQESVLKSSNPPTSILYQLYLESGALINGFDLWSAFYSVIAGVDADEDEANAKVDKATAQSVPEHSLYAHLVSNVSSQSIILPQRSRAKIPRIRKRHTQAGRPPSKACLEGPIIPT